jgi:hypothetical protein
MPSQLTIDTKSPVMATPEKGGGSGENDFVGRR